MTIQDESNTEKHSNWQQSTTKMTIEHEKWAATAVATHQTY